MPKVGSVQAELLRSFLKVCNHQIHHLLEMLFLVLYFPLNSLRAIELQPDKIKLQNCLCESQKDSYSPIYTAECGGKISKLNGQGPTETSGCTMIRQMDKGMSRAMQLAQEHKLGIN